MNKYAAGGKCGSMSSGGKSPSQVKEVNSNLSALMAERNKLDSMFSSPTSPAVVQRQNQPTIKKQESSSSSAIVTKVSNGTKETRASDIDFILSGDF